MRVNHRASRGTCLSWWELNSSGVSTAPFLPGVEIAWGDWPQTSAQWRGLSTRTASFPQRGLQLSPVVIPKLVSAAWMREADYSDGFWPEHPPVAPWDQSPSSPSQTFRLLCSLLCCSSQVRGPSRKHSESHIIILFHHYVLQGDAMLTPLLAFLTNVLSHERPAFVFYL